MTGAKIEVMRCDDCDTEMEDVAQFGTKYECPDCGLTAQAMVRWEEPEDAD